MATIIYSTVTKNKNKKKWTKQEMPASFFFNDQDYKLNLEIQQKMNFLTKTIFYKKWGKKKERECKYNKSYTIHINVHAYQTQRILDIFDQLLKENDKFSSSISLIKATTRTDEKMDGLARIIVYPNSTIEESQYVLDVCVHAFSMLRGQPTEVHNTYHVEGCVYYSGGVQHNKDFFTSHFEAKNWSMLFKNDNHVLWVEQQPLEYSLSSHSQMEEKVLLTKWFTDTQNEYEYRLISDEIYDASIDNE